jgi:hypothetical protein
MDRERVLDLVDAWVEGRIVPAGEIPLIAKRARELAKGEAAKA